MIVPGICRGCYSFDEGTNETWPGSGVYCYMFKCAIMPRSWDSKGWLKPLDSSLDKPSPDPVDPWD